MVRRTIALDGKDVATRLVRMTDTQIDSETSRSNLRVCEEAVPPDNVSDVLFES
jgi:hypothetical protein